MAIYAVATDACENGTNTYKTVPAHHPRTQTDTQTVSQSPRHIVRAVCVIAVPTSRSISCERGKNQRRMQKGRPYIQSPSHRSPRWSANEQVERLREGKEYINIAIHRQAHRVRAVRVMGVCCRAGRAPERGNRIECRMKSKDTPAYSPRHIVAVLAVRVLECRRAGRAPERGKE